MTNLIPFKARVEGLFVQVPSNSVDHYLLSLPDSQMHPYGLFYFIGNAQSEKPIILPEKDGDWQIVGLCKDITDEQADQIVQCVSRSQNYFVNYKAIDLRYAEFFKRTALDSFLSLTETFEAGEDYLVIIKNQ